MREHKIIFTFQDANGDYHIECLWASKAGTCYRIDNIPFFTPGIAKGDIVTVNEEDDQLYFDMVIEPSGHSTIQVVFFNEMLMEPAMEELEKLGCSWEGNQASRLAAVDIPYDVQYTLIQHFLEKGEEEQKWTYKEACLSHY